MSKVPRWGYKRTKTTIWSQIEYEAEDLVFEEERTFVFGYRPCIWLLITSWMTGKTQYMMCWTNGFYITNI